MSLGCHCVSLGCLCVCHWGVCACRWGVSVCHWGVSACVIGVSVCVSLGCRLFLPSTLYPLPVEGCADSDLLVDPHPPIRTTTTLLLLRRLRRSDLSTVDPDHIARKKTGAMHSITHRPEAKQASSDTAVALKQRARRPHRPVALVSGSRGGKLR